jgi:DNA-binding MarR family transcriptional regulator
MSRSVQLRRGRNMAGAGVRVDSELSTTRLAKRTGSSEPDARRDVLLTSVLQTGAKLQASLDKRFLRYGLTMLDASIVLRCAESEIVLTPGKLAAALGRDKGKITRVVDRLERDSFVTRVASTVDRRKSFLKPTKRAQTIAPSLRVLFSCIHRELFAEMNDRDLQKLTQTLVRLRKNATSLKRDPTSGSKRSKRRS